MSKYLKRDSNTISLATFWENFLLQKYNFEPPYQRYSVWNEEKQSFLIDTILRNFPIPPIFLHQHIDAKTGRTNYDVIDGKQRLTSIIRFIRGEIAVSNEEEDDNGEQLLAGKKFSDLDDPSLEEFKQVFWRYQIPVEYIDTDSTEIVDNIFDRLNRNGEPLNGQELRNAKYNGAPFLKLVEEASRNPVWAPRLAQLDVQRMGDKEFISELLFALLEGSPCEGREARLDELYTKYAQISDPEALLSRFELQSKVFHDLAIPAMETLGVSHVYGLWTFVNYCERASINPLTLQAPLIEFYERFQAEDIEYKFIKQYKNSVSYATRTKGQRSKRLLALIGAVGI